MTSAMDRRGFVKSAAATGAFSIVPRHVLGGASHVPPSDKITLAQIGMGTQGFKEIGPLLENPEVQIVAICDPNRDSNDYIEWGKGSTLRIIRNLVGSPTWRPNETGCPGGREVGREAVDAYYARERGKEKFKATTAYADFREMLDREKDLDAVKINVPDHLHAAISIAAMRKGKHVMLHKPLSNRLAEARKVVETARESKVGTHLLAYGSGSGNARIAQKIREGAIGKLREIHNWSNRPVWPQYTEMPQDRPPIPEGFDWQLWLGPSLDRPYHPHYTHTVFRGWYEFGGGAIADMGVYSLWPVFTGLELGSPISAEALWTHTCSIVDQVSRPVRNDFSFPIACTIHLECPIKGQTAPVDLFWYDGGMKPRPPKELAPSDRGLPIEGILFVGDEGKIIASFGGRDPQLLTRKGREPLWAEEGETGMNQERERDRATPPWLSAFKGGAQSPGSFLSAGPISDAVTLGAVALRARKRVLFDSENMRIINMPEANKYLRREYRPGWEL